MITRRLRVASSLILIILVASCLIGRAQTIERGTISGSVKTDQGTVRGFRVRAHNLESRFWYVVFTKDGRYTIPQALPGSYEVHVEQEGYDSPRQKVNLKPGQTVESEF